MRKITVLPSMSNVTAGSTAVLDCPTGLTYDKIVLDYSGVTLAEMTNIELRLNGKTIMGWKTGTLLDMMNTYYGFEDSAGFLTLHFVRPWMANLQQRRSTAIGTSDVDTMTLHMDIAGTAANPVIKGYAHQSGPTKLGSIVKVRSFPKTFATSGRVEIDSIPRSARIVAVHLFKSDISNVEVEMDSVKIIDTSKTLASELCKKATPVARVPQDAAATHVDFCMDGDNRHVLIPCGDSQAVPPLAPAQDLRLRLDLGSAGSVDTIVEYLDGFHGI